MRLEYRLGCRPGSGRRGDSEQARDRRRRSRTDQILARPLRTDGRRTGAPQTLLERAGAPIRAMQALLFGMPKLSIFEGPMIAETRDYLRRILQIGAALGAQRFVFGSPKNRDRGQLSESAARQMAVDFFRGVAETAAALGVVFCIEPNPPVYQCNFMTNTAEALAVVQAVNHAGLGIHLDTGIMYLNGESFEAAISAATPWLKHFHVSHPQLAAVADGDVIDHATIARALAANDYSGMVSVEMRSAENPADNLVRLDAACEVLNRHYRQ